MHAQVSDPVSAAAEVCVAHTHLQSAWLWLLRVVLGNFGQEARGQVGRCHVAVVCLLSLCRSALLCSAPADDQTGWSCNHHVGASRKWVARDVAA